MKNQTTTKEICRLQIQKQIELNDNYDMNSEEIFVNCLTEEEFDRKVKYILESKGFLDYQKRKIRRYFQHIKDTGWFHRFTYMDYKCAVEFDDLGRWRIFMQPKKLDHPSPLYDHQCNCQYCGYSNNGSRFGLKGFPLGLWDYSDKIGLDDMIGLPTFSATEWEFDYFREKKKRYRDFADRVTNALVDISYAIHMNKKLVDCWIKYQETKR